MKKIHSETNEIEIDIEVMRETQKALLVSNGKNEAWVPKSQIKDKCEDNGKITSIFISEWLAKEKGLI